MTKYEKISKNIQQITIKSPKTERKIKWVNIVNPGKEELEFLMKSKEYKFNFKELSASSAKVFAQRPTIEKNKDYFFLILHFPVFKKGRVVASEIEFFIGHGFIVTLHNNEIKSLEDFFNKCKKGDYPLITRGLESSAILLYEILNYLILSCYTLIDQNSAEISKVEDIIFENHQKEVTSKILSLRRNIIDIRRILQNHKNMLKKIMEMKSTIVPTEKLQNLYVNLINHTKRIWEYSESQKEVIEAFHDTNESILNDKISSIMKTLTIFSVIVFPLTLFAGIFSMNTTSGMPFLNIENGFWIIMGMMGMGVLLMILFFIKKKWI